MSFVLAGQQLRTSARCSSSSTRSTSGRRPDCATTAIMARLRRRVGRARSRTPRSPSSAPSPIPGLSVAGGFKLMVEDRGGLGLADLAAPDRRPGRASCRTQPGLASVATQFRSNTPQLFLDIDRTKVAVAGRVARRRQPDARRCTWARSTSTASTSSAGTGRSRSRPRASSATGSRTSTCSRSATSGGRWSRWARWSTSARSAARSSSPATTSTPPPPITGNMQPGRQHRRRHRGHRPTGRPRRCRCR